MALGRAYKVGVFDTSTPLATGATVTTTTPTPILYGVTVATADCNISAIRCGIAAGSSFPANAVATVGLNIVTGTVSGGVAAISNQLSGLALASNTTFLTAGGTSGTPITALTLGKFLWSQDLPFTAGSNWGEWFTPGFEINIPVSTKFAVYVICSAGGTGTTFSAELEFTE
jgi:hypothetical protein